VKDGCLAEEVGAGPNPEQNAERCVYGEPSSTKDAVLIGDSMAISYLPGIRAALEPAGYRIHVFTMQQCPAFDLTVKLASGAAHTECTPFRAWAIGQITTLHPDLVIAVTDSASIDRLVGAPADRLQVWKDAAKRTMDQLAAASDRVVVIDPPPPGQKLESCATRLSVPANCMARPTSTYENLSAAVGSVTPAGAKHVSVVSWFCGSDGACPAFIGTSPVFVDGGHLTDAMSKHLAPLLAEVLLPK
jgi:hypothetical protein